MMSSKKSLHQNNLSYTIISKLDEAPKFFFDAGKMVLISMLTTAGICTTLCSNEIEKICIMLGVDKISKKRKQLYQEKCTQFQEGLKRIQSHYQHPHIQDKLIKFAEKGFETLKSTNSAMLQQYMECYQLRSKQEYLIFVQKQIDETIALIGSKSLISYWYEKEKIQDQQLQKILYLIHPMLGGICKWGPYSKLRVNMSTSLDSRLNNKKAITVHEGEHFFQNGLVGNRAKNNIRKLVREISPLYQEVFSQAKEVFPNISTTRMGSPQKCSNESFSLKEAIVVIKKLFGQQFKPNKKMNDLHEILAIIKEIRLHLQLEPAQSLTVQQLIECISSKEDYEYKNLIATAKSPQLLVNFINSVF